MLSLQESGNTSSIASCHRTASLIDHTSAIALAGMVTFWRFQDRNRGHRTFGSKPSGFLSKISCFALSTSSRWSSVLLQSVHLQSRHRSPASSPGDTSSFSDIYHWPMPVCRPSCFRPSRVVQYKPINIAACSRGGTPSSLSLKNGM